MIYLEDYTSYKGSINDDDVYKELLEYIKTQKSLYGEVTGCYGKRHFEFKKFRAYIRINTRRLEGKDYTVTEIADFEKRNGDYLNDENNYYINFLKWCMENSIYPIFIETDEYNVFEIFGTYITDDGRPTSYNDLLSLGFKFYPSDHTKFYYIKL